MNPNAPTPPLSRSKGPAVALVATILVAALASVLFWDDLSGLWKGEPGGSPPEADVPVEPGPIVVDEKTLPEELEAWSERLGHRVQWPSALTGEGDCEQIESQFASTCRALASGSSDDDPCGLLREATELLLDAPPGAVDIKRPQTMAENAVHLYRILGARRLDRLRRLAVAHEDLAEPIALTFFRYATSRGACEERDGTDESVYRYGLFALETLGGQGYLSRRSPRVAALGCFYALAAVERASKNVGNPEGFDAREQARRCRARLDSQQLVFEPQYAAALERMTRR